MGEFLTIVSSFPTAVYTGLVGLAMVFWILVIAGGMGLELFDVDLEIDAAAEGSSQGMVQLLSVLGVGTVPFSIMFTAFAFWGWTLSFVTTLTLREVFAPSILMGFGVLIASAAVALPMTGIVTYPLRRLFDSDEQSRETVIGSVCRITTSEVDAEFGRASLYHEGADLVLSIRCEEANALGRGDEALIIDYDDDRDVYLVEPYADLLEGAEADDLSVEDLIDREVEETALADEDLEAAEAESADKRERTVEETTS
jgi:hypothetical protein